MQTFEDNVMNFIVKCEPDRWYKIPVKIRDEWVCEIKKLIDKGCTELVLSENYDSFMKKLFAY